MCLLDQVVAWDAQTLHARSASHRRLDNPLRNGDKLRAVHACEYGAQAMAVHGGLCARAAGETAAPGFLVALRQVQLTVARLDDLPGDLDVYVERLLAGPDSWQYGFRVEHAGRVLAQGRAAVVNRSAGGAEEPA
ncbi:phosphotransferase [Tahibacter amnicola]|uniref:Phosphotransferase n=1 Tax=Tahibacter amnicola TaxID=2976241 RepID=A0ABY6BKS5_9GAMM|nr:phosphotransferase [Tahibacter amnicola]UXI70623.1 phosphotransferase [Tahibacter amnicola]